MHWKHLWIILAVLSALTGTSGFDSPGNGLLPQLIKRVKPSVITVSLLDEKRKFVESGSGFFISSDLVVTSRHVFFNKAKTPTNDKPKATTHFATVRTNDRQLPRDYPVSSVVFDDVESDIIILQVGNHNPDQEFLTFSSRVVEEGDDVFVISSPHNLIGVVTSGIVSAVHNDIDLQIDAAIGQGSSGAPVLDYEGQVIGVVNGYMTVGQNMNFAISAQFLRKLLARLVPQAGDTTQYQLESGESPAPTFVPIALREWVQRQENITRRESQGSTALAKFRQLVGDFKDFTSSIFTTPLAGSASKTSRPRPKDEL